MLCLGTGTEVGKTWVGAATLQLLRRGGLQVSARKPVQSFDPDDPHPTDAAVLAGATGEAVESVCAPGHAYPVALAPAMATEALGLDRLVLDDLVAELGRSWPHGIELGWVEAAGGVRSPFTDDGDSVDLAARLDPDAIVLVADAELGALNAIRLCHDALQAVNAPVTVVLNRFDPTRDLHRRNLAWLRDRDGFTVATSPEELAHSLSRGRP